MQPVSRTKLFISYSHVDQAWLRRLQVHLRPLQRTGLIEVWDDTRLSGGDRWRQAIAEAIGSAKVAILLISPDFLASDFIATEELPQLLQRAREEGALILPVIVRPSRFERTESLSSFQSMPAPNTPLDSLPPSQQDAVLDQVVFRVERLLKARQIEPPPRIELSPAPRTPARWPRLIVGLVLITALSVVVGVWVWNRSSSARPESPLPRVADTHENPPNAAAKSPHKPQETRPSGASAPKSAVPGVLQTLPLPSESAAPPPPPPNKPRESFSFASDVAAVAILPGGRMLAAAVGGSLFLQDLDGERQTGPFQVSQKATGQITNMVSTPGGELLASVSDGKESEILLVSVSDPGTPSIRLQNQAWRIKSLSGNAQRFVFADDRSVWSSAESVIKRLDEIPYARATSVAVDTQSGAIAVAACRADRKPWMRQDKDSSTVRLFTPEKQYRVDLFLTHKDEDCPEAVAISSDGRFFVTAGLALDSDEGFLVRQTKAGSPKRIELGRYDPQTLLILALSRDGKVAAVGHGSRVAVINIDSGKISNLEVDAAAIRSLALDDDGTLLAIAAGTRVHLWWR